MLPGPPFKYLSITSAQNNKIKQLIRLKNRRKRDKTALFLIEGYREIKRAFEKGLPLVALFFCSDFFLGNHEFFLIDSIGTENFHLPSSLFQKISYRDRPDGLIAVGKQMQTTLNDWVFHDSSIYVVAESIEKPGNLGTILRSCDAAGVNGVVICDRRTDIYNPNVVRASVGTLFTVPVVEAQGIEAYQWFKERNISLIATSPSASLKYTEASLKGPLALLFGTEQLGLSEFWIKRANLHVKIPMLGAADSLNVAMATTLILYEILRQKNLS